MLRLTLILLVVLTCSCGENFFSSPKEFDLGQFENQISVVGRLVNTDIDTLRDLSALNNLGFLVSRTKSVLDSNDFELIKNADILLTGEDGTELIYTFFEETGYYLPPNAGTLDAERLSISENTQYEIVVNIPGEETITASCETLSLGKAASVDIFLDDIDGEENFTLDRLVIAINDPEGENYYFLRTFYYYDAIAPDGAEFIDLRGATLYNVSSVLDADANLFTDELFDGKIEMLEFWSERYTGEGFVFNEEKQIREEIDADYKNPSSVVISLWSLTKEEYDFRTSVSANRDAEDNPFAEPIVVFSNIENGLGVFSLMKLQEFEFDFR